MNRRVVLPEFIQAGSFPPAASLGLSKPRSNEVGEVGANKSGDGFTMTFKPKENIQFISEELEIRRTLERNKISQELADLNGPIGPMVPSRKFGAELGAVLKPEGSESVKVSTADLQLLGGFEGIDLGLVELAKDLQQDRGG